MRKRKKPGDKKQRERQLSFEFEVLSQGKGQHSSLKKNLSSERKKKSERQERQPAIKLLPKKSKKDKQRKQPVIRLLPKEEKEFKFKTLSLEGVKTERHSLKETPPNGHSPKRETSKESFPAGELFFGNLITVEELAVFLGLAPQTIRNWVARGKLPYVKLGRRNMFLKRSMQEWLNRKEKPQWQ